MLPAHIIEEIIKREREKKRRRELFVDLPELEPIPDDEDGKGDGRSDDRGVVIIDFSV